jgi:hypothetical protein
MKTTYYKQQIPSLISNIKIAINQCMDIISQEIDGTLNDDKLHAVLKAKRMATEDVKFYSKEIDLLEAELLGKTEDKTDAEVEGNVVKKFTKQ